MGKSSYKRKYRYARVMAGLALAAAKQAEKDYERRIERLEEYGVKGEELARMTAEDISRLTPFLQSTLSGMYADPKMGPIKLKSMPGMAPELVQAGRRVKEGLVLPSEYAMQRIAPEQLAPGEDVASIRRIISKRPEATLELTGEETEALMPIAERAAEWSGYRFPVATTGARAKDFAETYNKKMAEYQRWKAVEARYRRKYAHEANKWKRIGTLAISAIATIVSFGALGPVFGALGLGTAATATTAGTGLAGAFGAIGGVGGLAGSLGTIGTMTALGAAGGAISGGWKGALIGGIASLAGGLVGGAVGGAAAAPAAQLQAPIGSVGAGVGGPVGVGVGAGVAPGVGTTLTSALTGGAGAAAGVGAGLGAATPAAAGGLSGMLGSLAPYIQPAVSLGAKGWKSFSELEKQNEYLKRVLGEKFAQWEIPEIPEITPPLPVTT